MAAQLALDERDQMAELMARGFRQAAVANILGRSRSTISRELRRNGVQPGIYRPAAAQARACRRRSERPLVRKMDRTFINLECSDPAEPSIDSESRDTTNGGLRRAASLPVSGTGGALNTNGLLRQYFPKGTRFDLLTAQRLSTVATLINNCPRRCLGYRTPAEVLAGESNRLRCISDS